MGGATAHIMGEMGVVGSRHGATAHIERDGDGVVGSRHGATVHIEGDGGMEWQVAPWCDRTH